MDKTVTFNSVQLKVLDDAVAIAEELISNHYKMSSTQWLRSRYDVKTLKDLEGDEIVDGPVAQVLGYDARKKDSTLGSSVVNYYTVCFQDSTILEKTAQNKTLLMFPFLVYIAVHELIHIIRFSTFQQIYSASSEAQCAMEEEKKVHAITSKILKGVAIEGMDNVLLYYQKWL